jgi:predicted ABC-class ATPase
VRPVEVLRGQLRGLNGKDYGAYQSLLGSYRYPTFELHVDQIPKDPYAPPHTGIYRVRVPRGGSGFSPDLARTRTRLIALRDLLARRIFGQSRTVSARRGTGNSGLITIAEPGQEVLERTSVMIEDAYVEARMFVGLPARGRRVRADVAAVMIFEELPAVVESSLFASALDPAEVAEYLDAAEDAEFLRGQLKSLGLVAFVADGAILPRASGVDQRPLDRANAVRFRSPDSLRVSVALPNAGTITGTGIPTGVTLLVGGGYHGKSTLLQALERGVYNHIPGDGRELCVSLPETVKVRAYSGRCVIGTDISPFIQDIPHQRDTASFSSGNASGSTSQAAFISESLEAGAKVLLMDEDTSATNFLIRDRRMQDLVKKEQEPITAYIDRVRQLHDEHDVSTVMVLGGSGDYLSVADRVIQMIEFEPRDVTSLAREVVQRDPAGRRHEGTERLGLPVHRYPNAARLDTRNEHGHRRVYSPSPRELVYGRMSVDLTDVEQLLEPAQVKAIGLAIEYARESMDGKTTLKEIVEHISSEIDAHGLDLIDPRLTGDLAMFRGLEFAGVLNRMRDLQVTQRGRG